MVGPAPKELIAHLVRQGNCAGQEKRLNHRLYVFNNGNRIMVEEDILFLVIMIR